MRANPQGACYHDHGLGWAIALTPSGMREESPNMLLRFGGGNR